MLAILASSKEEASRLSNSLQNYWNDQGIYTSVSLFENGRDFLHAMAKHAYGCVILDCVESTIWLIKQIQTYNSTCKIAVLIDNSHLAQGREIALDCRRLGVNLLLTRADFDQPFFVLSKGLCIL